VRRLARQGRDLLLFGPPRAGTTHLVAGLGHAMIDAGHRALFARTGELVQRLRRRAATCGCPRSSPGWTASTC
jgi:DNA replication protein DnaC